MSSTSAISQARRLCQFDQCPFRRQCQGKDKSFNCRQAVLSASCLDKEDKQLFRWLSCVHSNTDLDEINLKDLEQDCAAAVGLNTPRFIHGLYRLESRKIQGVFPITFSRGVVGL